MTEFELSRELNKLGFPQSRRDDAWYWLRPDMLIPITEKDSLYGVDKRPFDLMFENLIYYPLEADFLSYLGANFQGINHMEEDGLYYAYVNGLAEGDNLRSSGTTPWLALATVTFAKMLSYTQKPQLVEDSENKVQSA